MAMYAFGPFRLDANAEILFRGSDPLPVGKRAVVLLRVLVERAGAPVSKDTLNDVAWSGLAIGEGNLTVQIAALRRALGAVPGGEDWIVTLPRRGYRFVGPAVTKSESGVPERDALRSIASSLGRRKCRIPPLARDAAISNPAERRVRCVFR